MVMRCTRRAAFACWSRLGGDRDCVAFSNRRAITTTDHALQSFCSKATLRVNAQRIRARQAMEQRVDNRQKSLVAPTQSSIPNEVVADAGAPAAAIQ